MAETADDNAVLSPEELTLLRRVSKSRVWRLIADSLFIERERLFSGDSSIPGLNTQPATNEQLWMNRGAILLVQHLLQNGPLFVIWYRRHMEAQEVERDVEKIRGAMTAETEREYTPGGAKEGFREKPDFDL